MRAASFALLCLIFLGGTARGDAAGDSVVKRMDETYGGIESLAADVRDVATKRGSSTSTTYKGRLWMRRNGSRLMMRWDIHLGPEEAEHTLSTISDGKTIWIIDHKIAMILRSHDLKTHPPPSTRWFFDAGKLAKRYKAQIDTSHKYGTPSDTVVPLTPRRKDGRYQHLFAVLHDDSVLVDAIVVISADGTNQVTFTNLERDPDLGQRMFTVRPEDFPGYTIRDTDKASPR